MVKEQFIAEIKGDERIKLTDYAVNQVNFFLQKLSDENPQDTGLLESFVLSLNCNAKARIYVGEFFSILLDCVKKQAEFLSTTARIKNFKGTRFEEEALLKDYFTKQRLKELGLTWIMQGDNK